MGRPPTSNFGGTVPPVPPGLRPCSGSNNARKCDISNEILRIHAGSGKGLGLQKGEAAC